MFGPSQNVDLSCSMPLVVCKLCSGLSSLLEDMLASPCRPTSLNSAWHVAGANIGTKKILIE